MKRSPIQRALVLLLLSTAVSAQETNKPGSGVTLDEMVVTATRTRRNLFDLPASIEIIDTAGVEAANAISVDELFKTATGVNLQGSGFPGSAIRLNLRGLTTGFQSKRVLVLVDGRRINDQFQGNVEFALIPADSIERIEILRGPASALYGSNAMGGVILITTRNGKGLGKGAGPHGLPATRARAAGGSHGTCHFRLSHGGRNGPLDYLVTGSHVDTEGYTRNTDGTDRDWSARNLAGNFGWQIDENTELRFFTGAYWGTGTDENSDRESRKDYQHALVRHLWPGTRDAVIEARWEE